MKKIIAVIAAVITALSAMAFIGCSSPNGSTQGETVTETVETAGSVIGENVKSVCLESTPIDSNMKLYTEQKIIDDILDGITTVRVGKAVAEIAADSTDYCFSANAGSDGCYVGVKRDGIVYIEKGAEVYVSDKGAVDYAAFGEKIERYRGVIHGDSLGGYLLKFKTVSSLLDGEFNAICFESLPTDSNMKYYREKEVFDDVMSGISGIFVKEGSVKMDDPDYGFTVTVDDEAIFIGVKQNGTLYIEKNSVGYVSAEGAVDFEVISSKIKSYGGVDRGSSRI